MGFESMRAIPYVAIALLLVEVSAASASGVSRRVQATGLAAVVNGDLAGAAERAQRFALREAVEAGVGVLISSTTQASHFAVIEDEIFVATQGYVTHFDVVERGPTADGLSYRVTIDADVDLHHLEADLAAIDLAHSVAGRPRFLCRGMVKDAAHEWQWSSTATESLAAALAPLGAGLEPSIASPEALTMDDAELARHFVADVLIDAHVRLDALDAVVPTSGRSLSTFGIQSRSATLDLQVRWLDEDRPILQLSVHGRGAAAATAGAQRKAIAQAVLAAADTLRKAVSQDLRQRAYARRRVALVVEGAPPQLTQVEGYLRQGTFQAATSRLRRRQDGTAWFDIDIAGSGYRLARSLSASGLGGLDVEILQASANRVRLRVATAQTR